MQQKKVIVAAACGAVLIAVIASFFVSTPELELSQETLPGSAGFQGPVPYPASRQTHHRAGKKFPLDSICVYKKLPRYSQAPWLDSFVTAGVLPPVEKRLPNEPCVMRAAAMSDGPGKYGDAWRQVWASPIGGWNWGAGVSQGSWGITETVQQPLMVSSPIFLRNDKIEPLPNLATSWEWSKDGRRLTMHLIRGAKWSDGQPFTSKDVLFTWEDLILDDNVASPTNRTTWTIDGKLASLRAIDEYTVEWTFPVSFPIQLLFRMDEYDFSVSPAHVLKPFHPRYNKKADYVSFENCMPPDSLPAVTMGPWVPVYYKTDELLVLRRNPYFWKVDERGQQLPYMDEISFRRVPDGVKAAMDLFAGSTDLINLENPENYIEALKESRRPSAHFYVEWGPETLGFMLFMNQSMNLGVASVRDEEVRKLFREARFRRAITQAIDREGLCNAMIRGGFIRPWPGGLLPGSDFFDSASVVNYPYSPETAIQLLQELGLEDTDNDGIRNWTRGPMKGKNLSLSLHAGVDAPTNVHLGEALVPLLRQIGIQVNFFPVAGPILQAEHQTGQWDLEVARASQSFITPLAFAQDLAPQCKETPLWHREGKEPRVIQPYEDKTIRIVNAFTREPDYMRQKELMRQYNHIFTEAVGFVGLVVGSYGLCLDTRLKNIRPGTPVLLYAWTENNLGMEQIWVSPGDQKYPQLMPGFNPRYGKSVDRGPQL